MQDMRKFLSYFSIAFLAFASWVYFTGQNPELSEFSGISEAEAVPARVKAVKLDGIKDFINSGEHRVLFLHASWCPYCRKQLRGFNELKDQYPTDHIMAISTDSNAKKFAKSLEEADSNLFTPYIYQGRSELKDFIIEQGGTFNGGIPYFAIFKNGKFVRESLGLTHPKLLVENPQ